MTWLSWIGHLSFFLSALSFMMSSILLLRLLAIGSLLVGIAYNSMIAMGFANGVPNPELWNVVGWLVTFLLINVGQSIRLLVQNNEIKLPEIERSLLAIAAPLMRTRGWAKLKASPGMWPSSCRSRWRLPLGGLSKNNGTTDENALAIAS